MPADARAAAAKRAAIIREMPCVIADMITQAIDGVTHLAPSGIT